MGSARERSLVSAFDFDSEFEGLPAEKIAGGEFKSKDGNLVVNLNSGFISLFSAGIERVRLGTSDDGLTTGLVLKDKDGKTLLEVSENKNIISSASGDFLIDLDRERLLASESGLPRIVLGKV
jgi:hypothetical protein